MFIASWRLSKTRIDLPEPQSAEVPLLFSSTGAWRHETKRLPGSVGEPKPEIVSSDRIGRAQLDSARISPGKVKAWSLDDLFQKKRRE